MRKKSALGAITFALSLLLVTIAFSHDIWLMPGQFRLAKGDTLVVQQLLGSELQVEQELALLRSLTPHFELITPDGSVDLLSELPDFKTQPVVQPVLERKVDFDGLALVTMRHAFIHTEFSPEQFLEYLEHEEFEVEAFQDQLGHEHGSHEHGHGAHGHGPEETERYARTLKCLVQVGDVAAGDLHKRVLGHKLEVLLLQNPYLLDPGDDLDVQVLFEGEPLGDQLVTALNGNGVRLVSRIKAHTDDRGIARFTLDHEGLWLIRLVHLLPSPDPDVKWESYWTSYSFALDG